MASKEATHTPLVVLDGVNLHKDRHYLLLKQRIDDIRLTRNEDVLIATYPRTGTTWLGQIVSLMLASEDKYETVKKTPLFDRMPFLEMRNPGNDLAEIEKLSNFPTPRADKTHLPYRFVRRWLEEDRVRTIVTTRNPKDTVVSHFHFYQTLIGFNVQGSWDEFFEHTVKGGQLVMGPQVDFLQDWDNNKDKGDILFIKYEDMKKDIVAVIRKLTAFLQLDISEGHVQNIVEDSHINSMRADVSVNNDPTMKEGSALVRRGHVGGWKEFFTAEQKQWFDNEYKARYENLGIDVDYD